jgi:hypothetical protein
MNLLVPGNSVGNEIDHIQYNILIFHTTRNYIYRPPKFTQKGRKESNSVLKGDIKRMPACQNEK